LTHPQEILEALHLHWLARVIYYFLWLFTIFIVLLGQLIHVWNHKDFSVYDEVYVVAKDGYHILVLPPVTTAYWTVGWVKGKVRHGVHIVKEYAPRVAVFRGIWRFVAWNVLERVIL
jgi:hypothetical protein